MASNFSVVVVIGRKKLSGTVYSPQSHLVIGPGLHNIRPRPDDHMQAVTEHRKAEDIQSEDPSQFFQPFPDPLFPVEVVFAGTAILATQKRPPHAPTDQMERLNLILRTNLRSFDPRHRSCSVTAHFSVDRALVSLSKHTHSHCLVTRSQSRKSIHRLCLHQQGGWNCYFTSVKRVGGTHFFRFQRYCGLSFSRNRSFLGHRFTSSTKACINGSNKLGK